MVRICATAVGSQRGIQLWSTTQQHHRLARIWRQLDLAQANLCAGVHIQSADFSGQSGQNAPLVSGKFRALRVRQSPTEGNPPSGLDSPSYQQWLRWVQEPGVRCVDETTYLIDGIKHWLWVATSDQVCVLMLAPTRSSAELQQLLGEKFEGILTSDCFSAYNPQIATAKQKCLTHLERDLKALDTSRFAANRDFSARVTHVLTLARQASCDYHAGQLSLEQLQSTRLQLESQLQAVLHTPPESGWPADAQRLRQRLQKYWSDWFTFLSHPEVKPDNNDAERALRPVVVHRKVSGTARSDWGGRLVAQMFSFLETMRLQGANAVEALFEKLGSFGRSPPESHST